MSFPYHLLSSLVLPEDNQDTVADLDELDEEEMLMRAIAMSLEGVEEHEGKGAKEGNEKDREEILMGSQGKRRPSPSDNLDQVNFK